MKLPRTQLKYKCLFCGREFNKKVVIDATPKIKSSNWSIHVKCKCGNFLKVREGV